MTANVETQYDNAKPAQCENARFTRVTGATGLGKIELNASSVDNDADCLLLDTAGQICLWESAIHQAPGLLATAEQNTSIFLISAAL